MSFLQYLIYLSIEIEFSFLRAWNSFFKMTYFMLNVSPNSYGSRFYILYIYFSELIVIIVILSRQRDKDRLLGQKMFMFPLQNYVSLYLRKDSKACWVDFIRINTSRSWIKWKTINYIKDIKELKGLVWRFSSSLLFLSIQALKLYKFVLFGIVVTTATYSEVIIDLNIEIKYVKVFIEL